MLRRGRRDLRRRDGRDRGGARPSGTYSGSGQTECAGSYTDEVTQGLMVIREAIRAGFVGLQINSPLHTVRDLPRDWIWNPRITINDGADALFNSWENLKKALPAAAPARTEPPPRPPLPIPLPPRMPRHIDGLPP